MLYRTSGTCEIIASLHTTLSDAYHDQETAQSVPLIPGAVEACRALVDGGATLHVVTARYAWARDVAEDIVSPPLSRPVRQRHLRRRQGQGEHPAWFGCLPRWLMTTAFHVAAATKAGIPSVLFRDLPWNRKTSSSLRAYTWPEALSCLEDVSPELSISRRSLLRMF